MSALPPHRRKHRVDPEAEELESIRLAIGINQRQLAAHLGISSKTYEGMIRTRPRQVYVLAVRQVYYERMGKPWTGYQSKQSKSYSESKMERSIFEYQPTSSASVLTKT